MINFQIKTKDISNGFAKTKVKATVIQASLGNSKYVGSLEIA